MNAKFDELAKSMAQSVTRRGALKKFGVGLAGFVLATFGLATNAEAGGGGCLRACKRGCAAIYPRKSTEWERCVADCVITCGV